MAARTSAAVPFPASEPLSRAARPRTTAAPASGRREAEPEDSERKDGEDPEDKPPSPGRVMRGTIPQNSPTATTIAIALATRK